MLFRRLQNIHVCILYRDTALKYSNIILTQSLTMKVEISRLWLKVNSPSRSTTTFYSTTIKATPFYLETRGFILLTWKSAWNGQTKGCFLFHLRCSVLLECSVCSNYITVSQDEVSRLRPSLQTSRSLKRFFFFLHNFIMRLILEVIIARDRPRVTETETW